MPIIRTSLLIAATTLALSGCHTLTPKISPQEEQEEFVVAHYHHSSNAPLKVKAGQNTKVFHKAKFASGDRPPLNSFLASGFVEKITQTSHEKNQEFKGSPLSHALQELDTQQIMMDAFDDAQSVLPNNPYSNTQEPPSQAEDIYADGAHAAIFSQLEYALTPDQKSLEVKLYYKLASNKIDEKIKSSWYSFASPAVRFFAGPSIKAITFQSRRQRFTEEAVQVELKRASNLLAQTLYQQLARESALDNEKPVEKKVVSYLYNGKIASTKVYDLGLSYNRQHQIYQLQNDEIYIIPKYQSLRLRYNIK